MSRTRVAVLTVLVSAALMVPAGAASAQRVVIDDGTADVWDWHREAEGGDWALTEAGSLANVDVTSTTVTTTGSAIRVTSTYAELKKSGPQNPGADSWLKLSGGGGVVLRAWMDGDAPTTLFFTDKTARPGGKIHRAACRGAEVTFDYGADTVTSVLPLSCLPGDPDWVKYLGITTAGSPEQDQYGSPLHLYMDNVSKPSGYDDLANRSCFWECVGWTKVRVG
ncbi:hypothetical protein ABLE68_04915 [Nocardioides sp. CN2-186]|uniref:hypothetical protein n=1 Tax=Nocardioides tweenelious TaxID=3156607 RepID=UPI0032B39B35